MDPSARVDLVFTGDPVLTGVFLGLLLVIFIIILDAALRK